MLAVDFNRRHRRSDGRYFMNQMLIDIREPLDTERLWLRPPRLDDAPMVHEAVQESLANLRPWMHWAANEQSLEESENVARESVEQFERRESLTYRMLRRSDEQFVGNCAIFNFAWHVPRCEIGYWVRTRFEGQGYVTEAVNRLTLFAFETLGMVRVEITCDARNRRSAAVAERAGYTLEAHLRHHRRTPAGALADTLIYARLRTE